nr:MAG TPA: UBA1-like domain protein [Caudoviricetes sp.]
MNTVSEEFVKDVERLTSLGFSLRSRITEYDVAG